MPDIRQKIELTRKSKQFIDISLSFDPNPITGDLSIIKNERAITQSIKNIILTSPLESIFNRDMGSTIRDLMFELVDEGTAGLIQLEVRRAILYNEPRVELVDVVVEPRLDQNDFLVVITYRIVGYDQVFRVEQILTPTR